MNIYNSNLLDSLDTNIRGGGAGHLPFFPVSLYPLSSPRHCTHNNNHNNNDNNHLRIGPIFQFGRGRGRGRRHHPPPAGLQNNNNNRGGHRQFVNINANNNGGDSNVLIGGNNARILDGLRRVNADAYADNRQLRRRRGRGTAEGEGGGGGGGGGCCVLRPIRGVCGRYPRSGFDRPFTLDELCAMRDADLQRLLEDLGVDCRAAVAWECDGAADGGRQRRRRRVSLLCMAVLEAYGARHLIEDFSEAGGNWDGEFDECDGHHDDCCVSRHDRDDINNNNGGGGGWDGENCDDYGWNVVGPEELGCRNYDRRRGRRNSVRRGYVEALDWTDLGGLAGLCIG